MLALALALALMLLAGCGGTPDPSTDLGGSTPQPTTDADQDRPVEEAGPPPEEETTESEEAVAGGGDGISIELAGLPVGGGEAIDLDGTWCQVLFWGESLPAGVELEITAVKVGEPGGTLQDFGCSDVPPCVGVTISLEQSGGCAVTITPPSPDVELVRVRLDGVLRCPDRTTCDAVGATGESWVAVLNPTGAGTSGEDDAGGAGADSDEDLAPSTSTA